MIRDWVRDKKIVLSSMAPPSVRMFYVEVFQYGEKPSFKFDSKVYPVVAICHKVVEEYRKRLGDEPSSGLLPKEPEDEGWWFEGRFSEYSEVVVDSEFGIVDVHDAVFECESSKYATVVCPWPYDEIKDMDAISSTIKDLIESLQATIKSKEAAA